MKSRTVAAQNCHNYDRGELRNSVDTLLHQLWPEDGLTALVKPGMRVALKVNMLIGKAPDRHITTHPEFVAAVAELVLAARATPFIIDSPGGPYSAPALRLAYDRCGFKAVAEELGMELNYDLSTSTVTAERGLRIMSAELLTPALEADVIINLPKLKTHGLTTMTCAVKNLFGLVPGVKKLEYHMRSPHVDDFCGMLVDVAELSRPHLHLVDAVVAMEGEGPSGGAPRSSGLVLGGTDMHAVDMVASCLMGIAPEDIPTLRLAGEAGLAPREIGEVSILGTVVQPQHFRRPEGSKRTHILDGWLPSGIAERLADSLRPIPRFRPDLCTRCGVCVRSCPPRALSWPEDKKGTPLLDADGCIRCFCCQELCPEHAIDVRRSFLAKMLFR